MIDIFKRRKSDRRPLWHYFQKMHCKNDSLESWGPPARTSHVLPLYGPLPCLSTLVLPALPSASQQWPSRWWGRPIGSTLWSGWCPLGAQISPGSFLCVSRSKAKISTWWKAVEFISQSAAQTLFFFPSAASLGWDDCLMLLITLDPCVFLNTCA